MTTTVTKQTPRTKPSALPQTSVGRCMLLSTEQLPAARRGAASSKWTPLCVREVKSRFPHATGTTHSADDSHNRAMHLHKLKGCPHTRTIQAHPAQNPLALSPAAHQQHRTRTHAHVSAHSGRRAWVSTHSHASVRQAVLRRRPVCCSNCVDSKGRKELLRRGPPPCWWQWCSRWWGRPRRSAQSRCPSEHRPGSSGRSGQWCRPQPCRRSWSRHLGREEGREGGRGKEGRAQG